MLIIFITIVDCRIYPLALILEEGRMRSKSSNGINTMSFMTLPCFEILLVQFS